MEGQEITIMSVIQQAKRMSITPSKRKSKQRRSSVKKADAENQLIMLDGANQVMDD